MKATGHAKMQGKVLGFGCSSLLQAQGLPTSCRKVVGSVSGQWIEWTTDLHSGVVVAQKITY
jgi:hypothetical protein